MLRAGWQDLIYECKWRPGWLAGKANLLDTRCGWTASGPDEDSGRFQCSEWSQAACIQCASAADSLHTIVSISWPSRVASYVMSIKSDAYNCHPMKWRCIDVTHRRRRFRSTRAHV